MCSKRARDKNTKQRMILEHVMTDDDLHDTFDGIADLMPFFVYYAVSLSLRTVGLLIKTYQCFNRTA